LECASKLNALENSIYIEHFKNVISERGLSNSFENYKANTEKKSLFSSSSIFKISSLSIVVLVLFKFCSKQVGEKLQDNKQTENQQIEQIEFEKRMENELSSNSRIDNCYLILQKKLDGHKKDLDSVKKNRPNSLSNFVENLIINERDVSGFIDSNFYKTDFSDIYFQRLKSSLILRYTSKFDSLITNL
jgi:hypothetical protein